MPILSAILLSVILAVAAGWAQSGRTSDSRGGRDGTVPEPAIIGVAAVAGMTLRH